MTIAPVVGAELWFGSVKLTCGVNEIDWPLDCEERDATTFCSGGYSEVLGGTKSGALSFGGFADFAVPTNGTSSNAEIFAQLGAAGAPVSVVVPAGGAASAAVGDLAYTSVSMLSSATLFGAEVNDIPKAEGNIQTSGRIARGACLAVPSSTVTSTGSGSSVQIGALSATQSLYVALHVRTAVTGTVTVKIQSDDNSGFTSATDRITFTAAGSSGWQWGSVAGAITDTYWRAVWTVAGGGSYTFGVAAGIA